jgi:hypothetical protein
MTLNKLKTVRPTEPVGVRHEASVASFVAGVLTDLRECSQAMATPVISADQAHRELAAAVVRALREREGAGVDPRNGLWRTRLRLYDMRTPDEPLWDSDPMLDPRAPGTEIIAGLPEVAVAVGAAAVAFHGGQCIGLDHATLLHRIKSLRPTLSRRGGNARWRIPYQAPDGSEWMAVANVERETRS